MKALLTSTLVLSLFFFFSGCKKPEKVEPECYNITFDCTANITQFPCTSFTGNAFQSFYFVLFEPGRGRVARTEIHDPFSLHELDAFQVVMEQGDKPDYFFQNEEAYAETDNNYYQVGKTYEWRIYLQCTCGTSNIPECGSDFEIVDEVTLLSPVKLLTSGTIMLNSKDENAPIPVSLVN